MSTIWVWGEIQEVISTLSPLEGAADFLSDLRSQTQVIILSDTFLEFAYPLMKQLDFPSIFCHNLLVESNKITGYKLRQHNQKQKAVKALQDLNFKVLSAGDSFNDTTMLVQADCGIFFKAPENVTSQFPTLATTDEYSDLYEKITEWLKAC